jgi:hypothetical protein
MEPTVQTVSTPTRVNVRKAGRATTAIKVSCALMCYALYSLLLPEMTSLVITIVELYVRNVICRSLTTVKFYVCCITVVDYCVSSPCENGASCIPGFMSYTCDCALGYEGTYCEEG